MLMVCLLALPAAAQVRFEVLRATYGAGSTQSDVTERVKSLVSNGGLAVTVGADTLGVDPLPNVRKTLTVEYRQGIFRRTARASDFETLRIGNAPAAPVAPVATLKITRAQYGDGRRMNDVTALLNGKIAENRLEIAITNANLGGDPAPAVKKTITVDYEYNGQPASLKIAEGETLRLPGTSVAVSPSAPVTVTAPSGGTLAPKVPTLRILRATYGAGRRATSDVTASVAARVSNGTLSIPVTPDALGGDPAPGNVKTLMVEYEYNGQRLTATAKDAESLFLPAVESFRILSASYGVPGRLSVDVTRAVSARVQDKRAEIPVTADTLGGDPAPGVLKTLTVVFEVNGRSATASATDGETLLLPAATTSAAPAPAPVPAAVPAGLETARRPATKPAISQQTSNTGSGPCLYRQPNYAGEAVCLDRGQPLASTPNPQAGFRSVRLNGAPGIDAFEMSNFNGRVQSITADVPDLLQLPGTWWRYEPAAPIQSFRSR